MKKFYSFILLAFLFIGILSCATAPVYQEKSIDLQIKEQFSVISNYEVIHWEVVVVNRSHRNSYEVTVTCSYYNKEQKKMYQVSEGIPDIDPLESKRVGGKQAIGGDLAHSLDFYECRVH